MARGAILNLLRSQSKQLTPRSFSSGYHFSRLGTWPNTSSVTPNFNSAILLAASQKRWASHRSRAKKVAKKEDDINKITIGKFLSGLDWPDEGKDTGIVYYYGPMSSTIRKVKMLSLSTCCLSVALGPVLTFMTYPDMNVMLKGAVASSVIFLSASSTAVLNWLVSPYVHKIRWDPGADSFQVAMMTWLGRDYSWIIRFDSIRPAKTLRPFVTFEAADKLYFVDMEHCHNKELLAKLTPQKTASESAFKNL